MDKEVKEAYEDWIAGKEKATENRIIDNLAKEVNILRTTLEKVREKINVQQESCSMLGEQLVSFTHAEITELTTLIDKALNN